MTLTGARSPAVVFIDEAIARLREAQAHGAEHWTDLPTRVPLHVRTFLREAPPTVVPLLWRRFHRHRRRSFDEALPVYIDMLGALIPDESLPRLLEPAYDMIFGLHFEAALALAAVIRERGTVGTDAVIAMPAQADGRYGWLPEFVGSCELVNDRLFDWMIDGLDRDPIGFADGLGFANEPRGLPHLERALGRLVREYTPDGYVAVTTLADVIEKLGGTIPRSFVFAVESARNESRRRQAALADPPDPRFAALRAAEDPETPQERLRDLATDDDRQVRVRVAGNPSTPLDVLESFMTTDERSHVGDNPSATVAMLIALSQDDDEMTRAAAVSHPRFPQDMLPSFRTDPGSEVRTALVYKLATAELPSFAADPSGQVRVAVLYDPRTPQEIIDRLATDEDPGVRINAVLRVSLDLLERLCFDNHDEVRRSARLAYERRRGTGVGDRA